MSLSVDQAFQILELPNSSTYDEVRQAYRELVKVWHPDRFHDDEKFKNRATKKIQDINAAYSTLEKHFAAPPPASPPDDQFERRASDSHQAEPTKHAGQPFPNFNSLEHLAGYFSFGLQYRVYPCRIRRSNQTELTPDRLGRMSVYVLYCVLVAMVFGLPYQLLVLSLAVTGVLKTVEWYGRRFGVPDAMIFTELGVGMVEGIQLKEGLFTATICHTFLYEHIRDLRWEEDEISFQTVNGLRFSFLPTRKTALTVPDTKWFKKDVFAGAQVVAQIQDRRN